LPLIELLTEYKILEEDKERMDSLNFAYWLQGYLELAGTEKGITPEQTQVIQDHLNLVFNKVTPERVLRPESVEQFPPAVSNPLDFHFPTRDDVLCADVPAPSVETPIGKPAAVSPFGRPLTEHEKEEIGKNLKEFAEQNQQKNPGTTRCAVPSPSGVRRGFDNKRYC
jgi:hypothetical protein